MLERSLEIADVLRGLERGDGDEKPFCAYFGKRIAKAYLVCGRNDVQLVESTATSIPKGLLLGSGLNWK